MNRLNYEPYDVEGATVSAYDPEDGPDYGPDVEMLGVDPETRCHVVAIGTEPDIVLTGSREQLIAIFREALSKLGAETT